MKLKALTLILTFAFALPGFAAEIMGLVSRDCTVNEMNKGDFKNYFRGKIPSLGSGAVALYYLPETTDAGKAFFADLGMSQSAFENMWNEMKLSGKTGATLTKVASEEEMMEKVKGSGSALGFVTKQMIARGNAVKGLVFQ